MESGIELAAGDYRLTAAPSRGGSILTFEWRGQSLMRPATGPGILDVACFPIVPFSNRIAGGRFAWNGRQVTIAPNLPEVDPDNPLHGFGWLSEWVVASATGDGLRLVLSYPGQEWPWPHCAELAYELDAEGLTARLALSNLAGEPMPAGLGFHPYFPRTSSTLYHGLHRGEWQEGGDGLPTSLLVRETVTDWWLGEPVGTREVDTVYVDRDGTMQISWPERGLVLEIDCSDNLRLTSVYVPGGADWFCVEPVSHMTDALNRAGHGGAMTVLQPNETVVAEMRMRASALPR